MQTFSLFIWLCLTSSFAAVIITTATRCHCLIRSIKMSCNKLLSQSSCLVLLMEDDFAVAAVIMSMIILTCLISSSHQTFPGQQTGGCRWHLAVICKYWCVIHHTELRRVWGSGKTDCSWSADCATVWGVLLRSLSNLLSPNRLQQPSMSKPSSGMTHSWHRILWPARKL